MPSLFTVSNRVGFTRPPRGKQFWIGADVAVRKQDEIVASSTFGNSTAETTIGSLSIPALALSNQGGIRSFMGGTIRDDSLPSETVTVRTKYIVGTSTTTIAESSGISLSPSTKPRSWSSEVVILGSTLSTQLRSYHYIDVSSPSTLLTHTESYTGIGNVVFTVPNTTAAATITTTLQFSTASTNVGASIEVGTLETLA